MSFLTAGKAQLRFDALRARRFTSMLIKAQLMQRVKMKREQISLFACQALPV
jgi:hypothetical protein